MALVAVYETPNREALRRINDAGELTGETRYLPFSEVVAGSGLMDFRARMYDPWLGRFVQPDTIVPGAGNPQAYNRFGYVLNNPINYNDPTGHKQCDDEFGCSNEKISKPIRRPLAPYTNPNLLKQDTLFSHIFLGSGKNGSWTKEDWKYYYKHRDDIYINPEGWINPESEKGWALFATQA